MRAEAAVETHLSCTTRDVSQVTTRKVNFSCGFRNNPRLGASNTPFARWLPAEYDDGISQPKGFNNRTFNNFLLPLVGPVAAGRLVAVVSF